MASVQRYRRGEQKIYKGMIDAGVKVEIGDLVGLVSNYVVNPEASGLTTIAAFKAVFLGVLIEGATAGTETTDTPCLVGVTGVYEFPVAAALGAALYPGKAIAPVAVTSVVQDQLVAAAADRDTAIGLLASQAAAGDLTLLVDIVSAIAGMPLLEPAA